MRGVLLRHLLYPTWHWLKREGVNRAVKELNASQWLTTDELLRLQQAKLSALIRFARESVPYYREHLGDIEFGDDGYVVPASFARAPVLKKDVIRSERSRLISEDLQGNKLFENSTSGSTGEATRFYTDARSMPYRKAALLRSDTWTGWRLGDPVARLWGAPMDEKVSAALRGRLHGLVTRDLFLSSYDLSRSRMDAYITQLRRFKPVLIVAYPGPLETFAAYCAERGVRFDSLRAVVSSAETLWPHQRQLIEQALGVKVFDRYGSREVAHIASECEAHNGMHVSVERVYIEIVDEQGQPVPPGSEGEILVTDLDNYGMPLIRYQIGDRAIMGVSDPCSCGRGLPRLRAVEGRTLDIVRTPDGHQIGGTFWTILLKSRPGIRQFQIVQDRLDGIVIKYVRDQELSAENREYFTKRIREYCGSGFNVEFVEKDSITLTGSGKQRIIQSNIPKESGNGSPQKI
jgi:phenylacetate-CoA ligase